ncbi:hypothetical protein PIB30_049248 [Stylosanthes scabra]|uniref:Uncharacterized protein n=1 Tax=Stylosanthes scabra TaxID=79078 RepID=A0ABU6TJ88_9FABA|nr:hypothetical protein [Stylosanthes scabra]
MCTGTTGKLVASSALAEEAMAAKEEVSLYLRRGLGRSIGRKTYRSGDTNLDRGEDGRMHGLDTGAISGLYRAQVGTKCTEPHSHRQSIDKAAELKHHMTTAKAQIRQQRMLQQTEVKKHEKWDSRQGHSKKA